MTRADQNSDERLAALMKFDSTFYFRKQNMVMVKKSSLNSISSFDESFSSNLVTLIYLVRFRIVSSIICWHSMATLGFVKLHSFLDDTLSSESTVFSLA